MVAALKPALIFGALGFGLAYLVVIILGSSGDAWPLIGASGLAAFAVSYVLWLALCVRRESFSARRGALAGGLTGLLAHPVAWYLTIFWNYLLGRPSFPGNKPIGLIEGIGASFVFAFFGVLLTGWLTVPIGTLTGWLLARFPGK